MKTATFKYFLLLRTAEASMLIMALMPFHALLTVWLSTVVGHYTILRLWKEILLVLIGLATVYLLIVDHKIRSHTMTRRLVWLIMAFIALQIVSGLAAYFQHRVTLKALGYGLIVNNRFFIFFLTTWALALRTNILRANWRRLLFWPAIIVIVFGILQATVLPYDFLTHLGYGPNTIAPYQTINQNTHYIRIESTLRGVNPLGAYMMLVLTFLVASLWSDIKYRNLKLAMLAGGLVTLYFSLSRSAWIGLVIAILILAYVKFYQQHLAARSIIYAAIAALLVLGLATFSLRNNARFQNIFEHTQSHSSSLMSPNQGHLKALESGLADIWHEPLGRGVGTAGPASVYNDTKVRFPEDYYLQTGQETGWLGLALFVTIVAGVAYLLWLRRADELSVALFASLIGLTVVNLFLPAWSDDTLAYIWWGLAGIAMVPAAAKTVTKRKYESKNR